MNIMIWAINASENQGRNPIKTFAQGKQLYFDEAQFIYLDVYDSNYLQISIIVLMSF